MKWKWRCPCSPESASEWWISRLHHGRGCSSDSETVIQLIAPFQKIVFSLMVRIQISVVTEKGRHTSDRERQTHRQTHIRQRKADTQTDTHPTEKGRHTSDRERQTHRQTHTRQRKADTQTDRHQTYDSYDCVFPDFTLRLKGLFCSTEPFTWCSYSYLALFRSVVALSRRKRTVYSVPCVSRVAQLIKRGTCVAKGSIPTGDPNENVCTCIQYML
jgi:hypothetical protein